MQHGKDYMSDKPGFTSLDQLTEVRRVQAETRRIYSICFSERLEVGAAVKAGELIQAGAMARSCRPLGWGRIASIHPRALIGSIKEKVWRHSDRHCFTSS